MLCGTDAAVRVSGTSFCAPCGLQQHRIQAPASHRRRRLAAFGLLSSGLLFKILAGAIAFAAVGGVAATTVFDADSAAVLTEQGNSPAEGVAAPVGDTRASESNTPPSASPAVTGSSEPGLAETGSTDSIPAATTVIEAGAASQVSTFAVAAQAWAECVAHQAQTAATFDPVQSCGEPPDPDDFDFPGTDPPGHDEDGPGNSEDAPGHDEDGPGNSENAPGRNKPPKDK